MGFQKVCWRPLGNLCYKFIWLGDQKKKGLVLASWKKLVVPKASGGWGLKNPFLFSKALAAKNVWRILQGKGIVGPSNQ
jgi:hypothetical protein